MPATRTLDTVGTSSSGWRARIRVRSSVITSFACPQNACQRSTILNVSMHINPLSEIDEAAHKADLPALQTLAKSWFEQEDFQADEG